MTLMRFIAAALAVCVDVDVDVDAVDALIDVDAARCSSRRGEGRGDFFFRERHLFGGEEASDAGRQAQWVCGEPGNR